MTGINLMLNIEQNDDVYPISDDSLLLLSATKYARGNVLDLFSGTGVIGLNCAGAAKRVTLADISEPAIKLIKKNIERNGIKNARVIKTDLFQNLDDEKFDVIFMNPPYLPSGQTPLPIDISTIGGKNGEETTLKTIYQLKQHLNANGDAFVIFSTAYNVEKVYKAIKANNLEYNIMDSKKFFFEELILVRIYEKRRSVVKQATDSSRGNPRKCGTDIPLKGRK